MLRTFKLILPIFFLSIIFSTDRGWTHPQTGWQIIANNSMCFYLIRSAYIDGLELESNQQDVIGVFFNGQNIGWEYYNDSQIYATLISTTGDDGNFTGYPSEGDIVTLKIYDASEDVILEAQSLDPIPTWEENSFALTPNLYTCLDGNPILENGGCYTCIGDPNLDNEINVLDITIIINNIIDCNSEDCYNACSDYNEDQFVDVLDIILIINTIISP